MTAPALTGAHRRRLREIWRSAGWPCRDAIEVDLLAAGLLERRFDAEGRDTLRVTDAGVAELARTLQKNRSAFDAHEALVARVALEMQRAGRIVWRGLALKAPLASPVPNDAPAAGFSERLDLGEPPGAAGPDEGKPVAERPAYRWVTAMPDVFSIRHTTVEAYLEPAVHEIKVRRADLLADLRRPDKGAAYRATASQCWYVLAPEIAKVEEIPELYGVMVLAGSSLQIARPAPRRACQMPFSVWMALARANAEPVSPEAPQAGLGDQGDSRELDG